MVNLAFFTLILLTNVRKFSMVSLCGAADKSNRHL